ncbi:protein kinase domain-containing protein [Actinocorallia populi]|uniref:protein kinase domain-containing protein n=1 Tax=Actinocorallia populi TaxID=2079200 RepID=UPI000D090984|nr:protein kinase [Actinocorallia populi]
MELPRRLGPYRPLEHLGSGGMGEVYLARAPDGTLLAVKTIRADLLDRPALRVRMRREAEALARVRGDHLAELVGHDLDADPPYLATRYVQGRSLKDVVADEGPLPPATLWRLADGLARALASVHRAGYLHRDLKPANVMLDDGSPVVIDFGISHALDETRLTRHGRASGTPAYMAPELVAEGRAGPAGDVYSWAATVTHAATGRDAQWSALPPAALARVLFSAEDVSQELRDLLDAAFAPDPADRPTAEDLLSRLAPLAPARGADLHLDHPHDPGATSVTLTLPGPRRVTLELPPGTEPGATLCFPHQGRSGRNGGEPGSLYLRLVSPKSSLHEVTESASVRSEKRRSKHIFLLIPVLFAFGASVFFSQIYSATDAEKEEGAEKAPSVTVRPSVLYARVPKSCQLLDLASVQGLVPGAKIPVPSRETARLSSCDIYAGGRGLHIRLSAVGVEPYAGALEEAERIFQLGLDDVEESPYSQVVSRDLGLGDRSFSYMSREGPTPSGANPDSAGSDYEIMGIEALVGNVGVKVILYKESKGHVMAASQEMLRERLRGLAGEVVADFPGQAVEVTRVP